jgi:hypothetical protein
VAEYARVGLGKPSVAFDDAPDFQLLKAYFKPYAAVRHVHYGALAANARWQEPGDLPPSGPALFAPMKQQDTADSVVSNKTDAASIMFKSGIIQPLVVFRNKHV